jgi:hypothetical protein
MIVEAGSLVAPLCLQIIRINCPSVIYKEVGAFSFFPKNKNIVMFLRTRQRTNPEAEEGCYRVDKQ